MDRGNGRKICHDGFFYSTRAKTINVRYLGCSSSRRFGCDASAKITEDGEFTLINARHNHPRDEDQVETVEFKRQLREACVMERGNLKNIYERIAMRNADGAVHVPYNSIRSSMLRWRRATTPNIPEDLVALAEILRSGIVTVDGHHAVIFGNQEFIGNFVNSQYTFMDGTFKAVPRRPHFGQILTVFATCMDHAFPIIHIFMERRTRTLYDAVFDYLLRTFPNFVNENIVTDYEIALVESLRTKYPQATLHGCFFHYCQAVLRKAKALGIVRRIEGNINGKTLLKKYYALALLPADMIALTLETLQDMELEETFRGLKEYIERQWIGRVTPEHFSVYRQRHRTNNVMESYHRRLNGKLVRHPGIWDLLETLIDIQNTACIKFAQLERGSRVFRVAKKNAVFDSRLNQAWDKVGDGRFTAEDFLRQAIHFVEGLGNQLHDENGNISEEEEEPVLAQLAQDRPPPLLQPPLIPIVPLPIVPIAPAVAPRLPPLPQLVVNEHPPLNYFRREPLATQSVSVPGSSRHSLILLSNPPSPLANPQSPLSNPPSPLDNPPTPLDNPQSPLSNPPSPLDNPQSPLANPQSPLSNPPSPLDNPQSPLANPQSPLSNPLSPLADPQSPLSNPPSPLPNIPSPLQDIPSRSNSPLPLLNYNFPPIPEAIARWFAELGDDPPTVEDDDDGRWDPPIAVTVFDEETMSPEFRCSICYMNRVRYITECGHGFCTTCADRLYNVYVPRCGICRATLNRAPTAFYL